ncbi:unnamed protein product [Danaus chrysippus]|uniref:(African queen) hypothetical protein n=1 Tax=Danaus chrysippus TaxID=151541 RepID=A0A8J2QCZ4_9NEOP|nr:unnamed protein product [Danaus chrysippus]
MAETIEETYETAVTRKVVRKSLRIEENWRLNENFRIHLDACASTCPVIWTMTTCDLARQTKTYGFRMNTNTNLGTYHSF